LIGVTGGSRNLSKEMSDVSRMQVLATAASNRYVTDYIRMQGEVRQNVSHI
jgi:hypothetical protein